MWSFHPKYVWNKSILFYFTLVSLVNNKLNSIENKQNICVFISGDIMTVTNPRLWCWHPPKACSRQGQQITLKWKKILPGWARCPKSVPKDCPYMYVCVCNLELEQRDVKWQSRWLSRTNVSSHETTHTQYAVTYILQLPPL